MKKMFCATRDVCLYNCGVRVNAVITALLPAADYARTTLPTLQSYLPPDMYKWGFVALALVNVLLHVRVPTIPPPGGGDASNSDGK